MAVVPNALQVVRHRHRSAARRYAQVATKVEIELFEEQTICRVAIVRRSTIIVHQVFGVALRSRTFEVECHTTHIRLVVGDVGSFDSFKRLLRSVVHQCCDACVEILGSAFGALGERGVKGSASSKDDHHFFSTFYHDTICCGCECTAHGYYFEASVVEDGGQFACKPARTVGCVLRFLRFERIARDEGELKVELVFAVRFVECGNHSIGL